MALVLFVFYVCITYICVLNVITGVFCQSAAEGIQCDREFMVSQLLRNKQAQIENIRDHFKAMFDILDRDNTGAFSLEVIAEHIHNQTVSGFFALLDIDPRDAFALFQLLHSTDGITSLDADKFVEGCVRLKGSARSIDLAQFRQEHQAAFQQISDALASFEKRLAAQQGSRRNSSKSTGAARQLDIPVCSTTRDDECQHTENLDAVINSYDELTGGLPDDDSVDTDKNANYRLREM